jgi:hypothetical protein
MTRPCFRDAVATATRGCVTQRCRLSVRAGSVAYVTDPHKWLIHGERLVDDTPHIRVSLADVELPNHVRFTR